MPRLRIFAGLAAVALLGLAGGGCAVGPDYAPPTADAPPAWISPTGNGVTDQAAPPQSWWAAFADPELDSLVERAARGNQDLRISEARLRQVRAIRDANQADLWPVLDAADSAARQKQSQNQPLIGSLPLPTGFPFEYSVYNAGFDAAWEIDLFGAKRRALEASTADWQGAGEARNDLLVSVSAEVARNYVELRGAQRRLAIARHDLEEQAETTELTRARFQGGVATERDFVAAKAAVAGLRAQIPPLETAIRVAVLRLAVLLGLRPGDLAAELSAAAPIPPVPPSVPVGLPSDLLRRRPDIRQAERQLAAETARIGVATAEWYPKFSLTGDVGAESVRMHNWFEPKSAFWSIGPGLQWRILDFGRVRAEVDAQTARQEEALASYEKTVLAALQETESALVTYAQEQNRHAALAEQLAQSRHDLAMADGVYALGRINYIEILLSRHSVRAIEADLAASDQSVAVDLIALYKALGGGWEVGSAGPPP
jgi:NodT family efflux transporter outer membrane factor (OMF) lipoprotein